MLTVAVIASEVINTTPVFKGSHVGRSRHSLLSNPNVRCPVLFEIHGDECLARAVSERPSLASNEGHQGHYLVEAYVSCYSSLIT